MLYYVHSTTDTALKPLPEEALARLLTAPDTYRHCLDATRYAREERMARERGDESMCRWWEGEYRRAKAGLPCILFQGCPRDEARVGQRGSRHTDHMRSNGKAMLDIDHVDPMEIDTLVARVMSVREEDGTPFVERVGFVSVTPSGAGLRIVLNGREGSTLVDDQRWAAGLLGVELDECCKDYTRLSFAVPMQGYVRYLDLGVLYRECKPYADAWRGVANVECTSAARTGSPVYAGYAGYLSPYLIHDLEEELGGAPMRGERNKFVYRMACALRHAYGNDEEAIYHAIPHYGLSDQERRQTIRSALRARLGSYVPRCIYRLTING